MSVDDISIIRIKVTHRDPEIATEVSNTISEVFREMLEVGLCFVIQLCDITLWIEQHPD